MKEIVIKLSDEVYTDIQKRSTAIQIDGDTLENAVLNGILLPKRHGRLIDTSELDECKEIMNTISGESKYAVRMDDIRNIDTIIEADTEREE